MKLSKEQFEFFIKESLIGLSDLIMKNRFRFDYKTRIEILEKIRKNLK